MAAFEKTHALIEGDRSVLREYDEFWDIAGPEVDALCESAASRMPIHLLGDLSVVIEPAHGNPVEHYYGYAHLYPNGFKVNGMTFGFGFWHPLYRYERGCQIRLELEPQEGTYARALARIIEEGADVVGTLLSLSRIRVHVPVSRGTPRPKFTSPIDVIRAGTLSAMKPRRKTASPILGMSSTILNFSRRSARALFQGSVR